MKTIALKLWIPAIVNILFFSSCFQLSSNSTANNLVQKTGLNQKELTTAECEIDSLYELWKSYHAIESAIAINHRTNNDLWRKIENERRSNTAIFKLVLNDLEASRVKFTIIHDNNYFLPSVSTIDTMSELLSKDLHTVVEARFLTAQIKNN